MDTITDHMRRIINLLEQDQPTPPSRQDIEQAVARRRTGRSQPGRAANRARQWLAQQGQHLPGMVTGAAVLGRSQDHATFVFDIHHPATTVDAAGVNVGAYDLSGDSPLEVFAIEMVAYPDDPMFAIRFHPEATIEGEARTWNENDAARLVNHAIGSSLTPGEIHSDQGVSRSYHESWAEVHAPPHALGPDWHRLMTWLLASPEHRLGLAQAIG